MRYWKRAKVSDCDFWQNLKKKKHNNIRTMGNCDLLFSFIIDPKVDTWLFMDSPGPVLCILAAYLAFVLKIGPRMMEKRPAFQLNTVLILYNGFQVLFSVWLTCWVILITYAID